jgi:methylmalonyl-CoA mutase cobalamin-binding subunit
VAKDLQRYLRQIALPEIGPDGQNRLATAVVAVASEDGGDVAAEIAARYLAAAGVGTVRFISDGGGDLDGDVSGTVLADGLRASNPDVAVQSHAWPREGAAWLAALDDVDVIVRSGFDDDAMVRAAARLGIPAVVLKALDDRAEVIAFRTHGPCPHLALDVPSARAVPMRGGASAVVAGTLGASEALFILVGRAGAAPSRARHLSVPLDGGAPRAQEIPWAPECFACGGGAVEMVFP